MRWGWRGIGGNLGWGADRGEGPVSGDPILIARPIRRQGPAVVEDCLQCAALTPSRYRSPYHSHQAIGPCRTAARAASPAWPRVRVGRWRRRPWRARLREGLSRDTSRARDAEDRIAAAWELGPLSRADLARESGVPVRSASRLVNGLIARGWLREVVGADCRSAPVVGAMPLEAARLVFPGLFLEG
jgi:hypothetical protein